MKILDELPKPNSGRKEMFDWDTLFDGQVRLLEKGVDFESKTASMRSIIYLAAKRRHVQVSVRLIGDDIALQAGMLTNGRRPEWRS